MLVEDLTGFKVRSRVQHGPESERSSLFHAARELRNYRSVNNRAVYSYLFAPPEGGGIEKNIWKLGNGKNDLMYILSYIMTFVIVFQGYFMIFPCEFALTEHFLEYYL